MNHRLSIPLAVNNNDSKVQSHKKIKFLDLSASGKYNQIVLYYSNPYIIVFEEEEEYHEDEETRTGSKAVRQ